MAVVPLLTNNYSRSKGGYSRKRLLLLRSVVLCLQRSNHFKIFKGGIDESGYSACGSERGAFVDTSTQEEEKERMCIHIYICI